MEDRPREPVPPRDEVVERHEVVEQRVTRDGAYRGGTRPVSSWIWLVPLLIVVVLLVWYVLTRGERREGPIEVPRMETPTIERPAPEQRIEIEMPAPREQQPAAPAAPAQPQETPATEPPGGS
jgi:hypothetical protein